MFNFIVKKINGAIQVTLVDTVWQVPDQQPVFALTFFQRFFRTFYFGNIHGDEQQAADVSIRFPKDVNGHPDRKLSAIFSNIGPFSRRQSHLSHIFEKNIEPGPATAVFEAQATADNVQFGLQVK